MRIKVLIILRSKISLHRRICLAGCITTAHDYCVQHVMKETMNILLSQCSTLVRTLL